MLTIVAFSRNVIPQQKALNSQVRLFPRRDLETLRPERDDILRSNVEPEMVFPIVAHLFLTSASFQSPFVGTSTFRGIPTIFRAGKLASAKLCVVLPPPKPENWPKHLSLICQIMPQKSPTFDALLLRSICKQPGKSFLQGDKE